MREDLFSAVDLHFVSVRRVSRVMILIRLQMSCLPLPSRGILLAVEGLAEEFEDSKLWVLQAEKILMSFDPLLSSCHQGYYHRPRRQFLHRHPLTCKMSFQGISKKNVTDKMREYKRIEVIQAERF